MLSSLGEPRRSAAALGLLAGLVALASGWGFTVDDALISSRVAHHLALGEGYRFNLNAPEVDCVTPMGWAWLLALFSKSGVLAGFYAARAISAAAWLLASAQIGLLVSRASQGWKRMAILAAMAGSLPLGAWASSGMETGLTLLLSTLALRNGLFWSLAGGLASVLRPELTPWAVAVGFGGALLTRQPRSACWSALLLSLGPFLAVCAIRMLWFGRVAPLSVFAKPSDSAHGLQYAWGAMVLSGPPLLLLSLKTWRRLPRRTIAFALALVVHSIVLVGVGGDWMPLWRLALPVFPSLFVLGAHIANASTPAPTALRLALVALLSFAWHLRHGSAARLVLNERLPLLEQIAPLTRNAPSIAALDIGWTGAATSGPVVDLAGLTDERVAFLPGGHTSKRLPKGYLLQRNPELLVLLLRSPTEHMPASGARLSEAALHTPFARSVENHLARLPGASHYQHKSNLSMGTQLYSVYGRTVQP